MTDSMMLYDNSAGGLDGTPTADTPFPSTAAVNSRVALMDGAKQTLCVLVAPTGVNVATVLQAKDPRGSWHTFTASTTTNDGSCDCLAVPANVGLVRARMTPSAGAGTARVWAVMGG